jgi:hypothetical protein
MGTSLLIPPVKDIPGTLRVVHNRIAADGFVLAIGQMPGVPKVLINRDNVKGMDDAVCFSPIVPWRALNGNKLISCS